MKNLKKNIIRAQKSVTSVANVLNKRFLSPRVSGIENLHALVELKKGTGLGVLFVSNHLNANDPFIEVAFLPEAVKEKLFPITFLAKSELFDRKWKSFCMRLLGCIPMEYGSNQNVFETIKRIKRGETVFLFPEGKVSLDGELGEGTRLLKVLSRLSDIIIQPVRIAGLKPFWDIKGMLLRKRQLKIVFGSPFVLPKGSEADAVGIIRNIDIEKYLPTSVQVKT